MGEGQSKSVIPWFQKFFLGVPAVEDPVSSTEPVEPMQQETKKILHEGRLVFWRTWPLHRLLPERVSSSAPASADEC